MTIKRLNSLLQFIYIIVKINKLSITDGDNNRKRKEFN